MTPAEGMMSVPPWETGQRRAFRTSFDEDPEAYDRTRPVAPRHVFDEAVELAGLYPGSTVVEIGPGTGQATRPLAERGPRILALELVERIARRIHERGGSVSAHLLAVLAVAERAG